MLKKGLNPVININTKILILGSLPSDLSIQKQEYYANKNNDFWKLLRNVLNVNLENITYNDKIKIVLSKKIGLWDVYHSAERIGSLDNKISKKKINNFKIIKQIAPNVKFICFNGKEASILENIIKNLNFITFVLPSSSGANRRNQKERLNKWNLIKIFK